MDWPPGGQVTTRAGAREAPARVGHRLLPDGYRGGCFTSTVWPMMPPSRPPAAAPMIAPLTLSRLVVAPMTAPAVAPITASRLVLRIGSGAGAGAGARRTGAGAR